MTVKVRFAPSPTGRLHVGNVRTALINVLYALRENGVFVLRIDDTDMERSTKAFEDEIKADLGWLGMHWGETFNQSDRFGLYDAAAEKLKAAGFLYPCYESGEDLERKRKLQLANKLPPVYDRAALKLTDAQRAAYEAEGRKPHWRFKLSGKPVAWTDLVRGETSIETSSLSDPILIREDGSYLYTLPSVVDDIEAGITAIIRGEDHVTNSGAQIEIFEALGAKAPALGHQPLLVGADGGKLSKRLGTLAVSALREEGIEPMALLSLLAKLGTSDPVEPRHTLADLAAEFEFGKISRSPARFDPEDLKRINARLLHETSYAEVRDRLAAMGADGGEAFWNVARANLETLADVARWKAVIDGPVTPVVAEEDAGFIAGAADALPERELGPESWSTWTNALKATTGRKGRALFMPLRLALTGEANGPEMADLLPLIGRERIVKRLRGEAA